MNYRFIQSLNFNIVKKIKQKNDCTHFQSFKQYYDKNYFPSESFSVLSTTDVPNEQFIDDDDVDDDDDDDVSDVLVRGDNNHDYIRQSSKAMVERFFVVVVVVASFIYH